jgi:hypothetical protein
VLVGFVLFRNNLAVYAAELPDLRALRSLAAEATFVVRLEHRRSLTSTYAAQMKEMVEEQLRAIIQNESLPTAEIRWARVVSAALRAGDEAGLVHALQALSRTVDAHEKAD